MANIFQRAGDWLAKQIAGYINDKMGVEGAILRSYYKGDHRPQLARKLNQDGTTTDDNITVNFVGLAIDRSVSRLYRGGVKFVLPDGATAQQEYLDAIWDLNKKEIILYQLGLHGSVYGTFYFKISPDMLIDPYTDNPYPRLIPIDPEIIRIKTNPADMNDVEEYKIEYTAKIERDGRITETSYREITKHAQETVYDEQAQPVGKRRAETWVVENYEQAGGGQWQLVASTPWDYNFPPIIHGKNLPSLKSCYGDSDIDDAINVQDKANFVTSNTAKIVKFYAHPETIGTGFGVKDLQKFDAAVGSFHAIPSPEAKVYNLEMNSDLTSSRLLNLDLRQDIFDISREVDISSVADKIGALTNFGLRVLWSDAIDKNDTKRQLYGDFLLELNRRLLVLKNYTGEESRPGTLQWGEAMIVNVTEEMEADKMALEMGIIDKETVAKRYQHRYGKEWDDIKAALADEQTEANAQNADIGSMILRNFNRGEGAGTPITDYRQPAQLQKGNGVNAS